jgi:transposase
MGAPYSQDLRDRILSASDRGMATAQVARVFDVSPAWVRRVKQRRRQHGETSPRPCGGATVIKIDMERLQRLVEAHSDATIKELHRMLGAPCVESAVGRALRRLGLSFKKSRCGRRSRTAPTWPGVASSGSTSSRSSTPAA